VKNPNPKTIWDHTALPATQQVNMPQYNPRGMKGQVDPGVPNTWCPKKQSKLFLS